MKISLCTSLRLSIIFPVVSNTLMLGLYILCIAPPSMFRCVKRDSAVVEIHHLAKLTLKRIESKTWKNNLKISVFYNVFRGAERCDRKTRFSRFFSSTFSLFAMNVSLR